MDTTSISNELAELRNDLTSVVGALKSVAETQKLQGEQQKDQGEQIRELGRSYSEIAAGRGKISIGVVLAIVGPIIATVVATAKLGHTFVGQEIQRLQDTDSTVVEYIRDGDGEREQLLRDLRYLTEKFSDHRQEDQGRFVNLEKDLETYNKGQDILWGDYIEFLPEWGAYKERIDTINNTIKDFESWRFEFSGYWSGVKQRLAGAEEDIKCLRGDEHLRKAASSSRPLKGPSPSPPESG